MPKPFHPDELVLLNAVHDDPKSDAPRLEYAAWLADHGQAEHAEFIRLQCQQPYIAISNRDHTQPSKSFSFDYPYDDATADGLLDRMLALLPVIYRGERYAHHRDMPYYEEHFRGLPIPEVEVHAELLTRANQLLDAMAPLARLDLTIEELDLDGPQLADWLAHPIMRIVDVLRLEPLWTEEDGRQEFAVPHIETLGSSPVIDRLREVNFKGNFDIDAEQYAFARLGLRVHVDTTY